MEKLIINNLEIVISLIGTVLGLIFTFLAYIRNAKAKKNLQCEVKMTNALLPFICEAEKFTSFNGAEKKAFVMTNANQFAIENKIKFNAEQVSEKIEKLLALTKQVNAKSGSNNIKVLGVVREAQRFQSSNASKSDIHSNLYVDVTNSDEACAQTNIAIGTVDFKGVAEEVSMTKQKRSKSWL